MVRFLQSNDSQRSFKWFSKKLCNIRSSCLVPPHCGVQLFLCQLRFSIRISLLLHVPIVGCRHSCFRSTVTELHTCMHYLTPVLKVWVHRMNLKLQMFQLLEFCWYANDPGTHQCQSGHICLVPSSHCWCYGGILLTLYAGITLVYNVNGSTFTDDTWAPLAQMTGSDSLFPRDYHLYLWRTKSFTQTDVSFSTLVCCEYSIIARKPFVASRPLKLCIWSLRIVHNVV
jgi:hypothetical protein